MEHKHFVVVYAPSSIGVPGLSTAVILTIRAEQSRHRSLAWQATDEALSGIDSPRDEDDGYARDPLPYLGNITLCRSLALWRIETLFCSQMTKMWRRVHFQDFSTANRKVRCASQMTWSATIDLLVRAQRQNRAKWQSRMPWTS